MLKIPLHYAPYSLSKKDRKRQIREIYNSRKNYRKKNKTKKNYKTRPKLKSYRNKKSNHVKNAKKMYNIESISPSPKLAKATRCSKKTLQKIVKKGEGAYYSSGSRPNQTSRSWGIARLASAITGGPAARVDKNILIDGCKPDSPALKLAGLSGGSSMKERIIKFGKSKRKGKKYSAVVENNKTKKRRIIHFGATGYQQYKDSTPLGLYTKHNHGDINRMKNYFNRHSGTKNRKKAIKKEKYKSRGLYNPKILSHKYLW